MADRKELRVALVGTGMMGRMHSLAYATTPSFFPDLPRVRRTVVVDISEELARRGARSVRLRRMGGGLGKRRNAPGYRYRRHRDAQ